MYFNIDLSKTVNKPKLSLHMPNREKIANLTFAYNIKYKLSINQLNELSFDLPFNVELNHVLSRNPHIDLIKNRYLIKLESSNNVLLNDDNRYEEWFVINFKVSDNMDEDKDYKSVTCVSLPYELYDKKLISYNNIDSNGNIVSQNATQALTDILCYAFDVSNVDNALWTIGYINPMYNAVYRDFPVSNKTLLDFLLNDYISAFEKSIIIFDTINRTISLFNEDDIGKDRGLVFSYGRYLKTLEHTVEADDFCTRFKVFGNNGLTISQINPTGENYLLSFDPFILPYQEEIVGNIEAITVNGTVSTIQITNHGLSTGAWILNDNCSNGSRLINKIDDNTFSVETIADEIAGNTIYKINSHSNYLPDQLCHKLLKYNTLVSSKAGIVDIAESGTNSYNLVMPSHNLSIGDWIVNRTRGSAYSQITNINGDNVIIGIKTTNVGTGTTSTNLNITTHGLRTGDYIINKTLGGLKTAQAGTTETTIKIATSGLSVNDYIINKTRNDSLNTARRKIKSVVDADTIEVEAISNQAAYDEIIIEKYRGQVTYVDDNNVSVGVKLAEIGTDEITICIASHGLETGDYITNLTRNERRTITKIDDNTFTVSTINNQIENDNILLERYVITGQTQNQEIIIEKDTINGQVNGDIIYKYKSNTIRYYLFEREILESQLDIINNQLDTLKTTSNILLNNVAVQSELDTYTYYKYFTYKGTPFHKVLYTGNNEETDKKFVVFCKVSSIDNLIVDFSYDSDNSINDNILTINSANTWQVLHKFNADDESAFINFSGTTTDVGISLYCLSISDDEYNDANNNQYLLDNYCPDYINEQIENYTKEDTGLLALKEDEITNANNTITTINSQLSLESSFTIDEIKILQQFIVDSTWEDTNYVDVYDLYDTAIEKFMKFNSFQPVINISIINFLECIVDQHNWNKLNLCDTVRVNYELFNVDAKAKISSLEFDFENRDVSLTISNINLLNNKDKVLRQLYKSIEATSVLNTKKANWDSVAKNYNTDNDAIKTIPANPVIANNGTAIDHTFNTDGSVNISFEWTFNGTGNAYNIDGFLLYVRSTSSNSPYTFGSSIAKEQVISIEKNKRAYILQGVPGDEFYTFGIQAYRKVRADIESTGILKSAMVQPTNELENPYHPTDNIIFNGDILGTVNGISAVDIAYSATLLEDISSDEKLTRAERIDIKSNLIRIAGSIPPPIVDNLFSGELYQIKQEAGLVGIEIDGDNINSTINDLNIAYTSLITYLTNMVVSEGIALDAWDTEYENKYKVISIIPTDWNNIWKNYYEKYNLVRKLITTWTSKSDSTFIIGTSESGKRADYTIPLGSTSAQLVINQAINDLPEVLIETGIVSGGDVQGIYLSPNASELDNYYKGYRIKIISGTGAGQSYAISYYVGTRKYLHITTEWDVQPDNTSVYEIYGISGKVVLLQGNYTINDGIIMRSGVSLQGQGRNTIINVEDNVAKSIFIMSGSYFGQRDISISDLVINGNNVNNSNAIYGISLTGVNINISNIYFKHCSCATDLNIDNSIFYNNLIEFCDSSYVSGDNSILSNNIINYCENGFYVLYSNNLKLIDNYSMYNLTYGIKIEQVNNSDILGNITSYNGWHGIYMVNCNNNKVDNISNDNGTSYDDYYSNIFVSDNSSDNSIQGNSCGINNYQIISDTLPDQTGVSSTEIKLSSIASIIDDDYNYKQIFVSTNGGQNRLITNYTGSTLIATVAEWTTQPVAGDTYYIVARPKYGILIGDLSCENNLVTNNTCSNSGVSAGIQNNGTGTLSGGGNIINDGTWSTIFG